MTFLCITVAILTFTGISIGLRANPSDSNGTTEDQNITLTTETSWTLDDFIQIYTYEMFRMSRTHGLRIMGKFQNKPWMVDYNNTKYLLMPKTKEETANDLKEKLANHTGNGLICLDGICLDRKLTEERLRTVEAEIAGTVIPGHVLPLAFMVSVFGIIGLLGITGNILIISAVFSSTKLRNSTSVFLSGLALSDIVVLGLCLPMQVLTFFFSGKDLLSRDACKTAQFFKHFSIAVSSLTMAVISIERYIAICHPLKAKSYCTVKMARNCTFGIWFICLSVCIPVVFLVNDRRSVGCSIHFPKQLYMILYFSGLLVVIFGLPFAVMLPLYLKMFTVLWKSSKECKRLKSTSQLATEKTMQGDSTTKMRKKVLKMLSVVLVVFILSWGPAIICDMSYSIYRWDASRSIPWFRMATFGLNSLGLSNSFFNPLIYVVFSRQFRNYVKGLFPCLRTKHLQAALSAKDNATRTTENSELN